MNGEVEVKEYRIVTVIRNNVKLEYNSLNDEVTLDVDRYTKGGHQVGHDTLRFSPSDLTPLINLLKELEAQV